MTLGVSSNFDYGISRPDADIVRRFGVASVDYSNRVVKWPKIKRGWNDVRPLTVMIGLDNTDQTFNFFQTDKTRVNDQIQLQYGLQDWRHNYFRRSQEIDDAAWTKTHVTVASVDVLLNPIDGETDVDFVQEDSSVNTSHYISQNFQAAEGRLLEQVDYRASQYYKPNGREFFRMALLSAAGNAQQTFIASGTGALGASTIAGSLDLLSSRIEALPDGWYRTEVSFRVVDVESRVTLQSEFMPDSGSGTQYTGDGSSGGYHWGMQLSQQRYERSRDYIQTWANEIEPTAMNLVTFTEGFTAAAWTNPAGITATANTGLSLDGATEADTLDKTTATADLRTHQRYTPKAGAGFEGWFCYSIYLQNISATKSRIGLEFMQNTGVVDSVLDYVEITWAGPTAAIIHGQRGNPATGQIDTLATRFGMETDFADGWVRVWISAFKPPGLTTWDRIRFEIYPDYETADTGNIRVWGAQCDRGRYYQDGPGRYLSNLTGTDEILSNEDTVDFFIGDIGGVIFRNEQCRVTATDKFKLLADRVVGDGESPIIVTSITPAWLAFTLCSCYGGMSATTGTGNADIDWASVDTWMDYFTSNAIHVKTRFTGMKVLQALRRLGFMTQAAIYIEDNKVTFKRWTEIDTRLTTLGDDSGLLTVSDTISERDIINKQHVYADFDVASEFYQIVVNDEDTASVNTYGLHEEIIKDEQLNYVTSAGALALAQRMTANYKDPFDRLDVTATPAMFSRQLGESIIINDTVLGLAETYRLMTYELDMDRNRFRSSMDKSQMIASAAFTLDTSSLDGTDVLL